MLEHKEPDGHFNKRNAELHQFKILNIPETQLVKCFQHFYLIHYLFIKYLKQICNISLIICLSAHITLLRMVTNSLIKIKAKLKNI